MKTLELTITLLAAPVLAFALDAPAQTRKSQAAITPDKALEMLARGNDRFRAAKPASRNLLSQVRATAAGQYPFATVLSCIDSRTAPELVFDQGIGDIFNARLAGNIVTDEVLGSLEFAAKVAGSKLIAVVGHTSCGAVKGAVDRVELGHVTGLVNQIQPAVEAARNLYNGETPHVDDVADMHVQMMVEQIRERSPILREMLDKGQIAIVGAMHDLRSGKVTFHSNSEASN